MYTVRITVMSGAQDGAQIELKSNQNMGHAIVDGWEFTIGRGESCDLQVPYDTKASREHATLQVFDERIILKDRDSRNGTTVGETLINTPTPIQSGDLFKIGLTWFRVEEHRT